MTLIKTRFAPSPTGELHFGNIRTALFNWLLAHAEGGEFVLRIEDTDAARSHEDYITAIKEDLIWLGLSWDAGPGREDEFGPYRQTLRGDIYQRYYQLLIDQGNAYPCFCSDEALAESRRSQLAAGKPPRYAGTCANLDAAQIEEKRQSGLPETLRFRVAQKEIIVFEDIVRGEQRFKGNAIGDFIIRRADGSTAFLFSNAIDDALMGITHVLRGEDHLSNTPRQLMILAVLDLNAPRYGHLSMILDATGAKLSKRGAAASLRDVRSKGYFPIAILNYLARLGHSYPEYAKLLTLAELASGLDTHRMSRAPARHDEEQLMYWQKQSLQSCDDDFLWTWFHATSEPDLPDLLSLVPEKERQLFLSVVRDNITFPSGANRWAGRIYDDPLKWGSNEALAVIEDAGLGYFNGSLEVAAGDHTNFQEFVLALKERLGLKGKALFLPLRAAMTGDIHGPELEKLYSLIGNVRLTVRLRSVVDSLNKTT
ncbi:MAG: glutamate--tRNA ligase [Gammaproteobacteria bacterium]|nr:MAG: glutamate--tRNA ligase [Gammaproteobacteria bacterium]